MNEGTGTTGYATPVKDSISVSISQIDNGFVIYTSGYKNGQYLNSQLYAADGDAIGELVTEIFSG